MSNNKLSKNSIVYLLGIALAQGMGVLTSPIYTRLLSTTDFGKNAVYLTAVNIMSAIIGFQNHSTLVLKKTELSEEDYISYKSNIMTMSIVFFVAISGLVLLFNGLVERIFQISGYLTGLMLLHSFGMYCLSFLLSDLSAAMQSIKYVLVYCLVSVISGLAPVCFIYATPLERYVSKDIGNALPYVLVMIIVCVFYLVRGKSFFEFKYWKFAFFYAGPIVFHGIGRYLLEQADRVIINELSGASDAGIYSLSYSLSLPTSALWTALNTSWNPMYARLLAEEKYDEIDKHIKNMIFTFTIASCCFAMCCPEFFRIMATKDYESGIYIMPVIILSTYFIFLYGIPINYEFLREKTKYIAVITSIGAVINIGLNYLIVPYLGMMGAALTTLVSWIFIWLANDYIARYVIKGFHFRFRDYLPGLTAMIIMAVLSYGLIDHMIIRYVMIVAMVGIFFIRNKKIILI